MREWASKTPKPSENIKEVSSLKVWATVFKNADFS